MDNFERVMIQKLTDLSTDEIIRWQLIFDLYQKLSAKDTLCAAHEAYNQKTSLLDEDERRYYDELNSQSLSPEEIAEIESEIVFADNSTDYWESDFPWEDDEDMLKEMLPRLFEMFANHEKHEE